MTLSEDAGADRLSTAAAYEAEAELTRRRLAGNLDELADRLTPGQIFDEALIYSRAGGDTLARALSNAMRENPVPSFLIGAGCVMYLSEKMGARGGSIAGALRRPAPEAGYDRYAGRVGRPGAGATETSRAVGNAPDTRRRTVAAAGGAVSNATVAASGPSRRSAPAMTERAGASNAMQSTTHDLQEQASGALDQVARSAAGAAGAARDGAASVGGRLVDTADRTRRVAQDAARRGRETATSFVAEQPLLAAAIGVAVGAAIASLFPPTETENQWLGDASDQVKDAAGKAASETLGSAKNVASKAAERVKSAAREEGFSPGAVVDAARRLDDGFHEGVRPAPIPGFAPKPVSDDQRAGP
ncbi:uncharacterized protein DUF3618 [Roseiarcus fermentans]|uniref:Uncharacterized protein DUF3618 n=1 Tax=Roseiarcus fermentans TaxID=1473586 RepID=A0A366EPE2_9HYPH|nr:DUF3618 domain-containing protein [Roseiarcus fermentans]RBP04164.1 uncharacterized protein DUF3618 [Roseiarcus fermentans]